MPLLRSRRSPLKALVSPPEPFVPPITDSSPNTTDSSVTNSQRRFSLRLANKLSSSPVIAEADESADKGKRGSVTGSSSRSGLGISRRRLRTVSGHCEKDSEIVVGFKGGGFGYGAEETGKKMRGEDELKDPLIPLPSLEPFTTSITDSSPNTSMPATQDELKACDIRLPVIVAVNEATNSNRRSSRVSRRSLRIGSYALNKDEHGSNPMESSPKHGATNAEVLVQDSHWHMEVDDKRGEVHGSAQEEGGCICLPSGSRVPKRKIVSDGVDFLLVNKDLDMLSRGVKKMAKIVTEHVVGEGHSKENKVHGGLVVVEDQLGKGTNSVFMGGNRVDNEVVGKLFINGDELLESGLEILASQDERMGKLVLQDHMVSASEGDINVVPIPEEVHEETLIADGLTHKKRSKRHSREEKGKENFFSIEFQATEGEQATKEEEFSEGVGSREKKSSGGIEKAKDRREVARKIAVELAHEFAFCKAEEEKEEEIEEVEVDDSMCDVKEERQEWFGPFSTALKLIEERESILRARNLNFSSQSEKMEVKIPWKPSIHKPVSFGIPAPSLKDLCLKVLCDNAEEVESLEGLPDVVKHNIAFMLCNSRKMSFHALCLLTEGFPIEIYLSDCSWATQKQFEEVFSQCNLDSLKVLQLDFCGRCLPDYVLHSTLAKAPSCLPSLNKLSLKGAYCLSDSGLDAIISSAALLKSLNLSQCSLITSKGIISLAEKLGPILQELYIDACHNVDAMLILPALKKLKSLEVLSIAHMETVTDKFLKKLIPVSGPKMRGLMVAGCRYVL
ncbi:hypothetical protein KSP40_PGU016390 [Platanthera guangdongensis]|uniref:Uncharacterized protein n=1 Tax=Platanthera guangdongensis TaxID=2320717 RepID=A0ABR2LJS6_9ASPA